MTIHRGVSRTRAVGLAARRIQANAFDALAFFYKACIGRGRETTTSVTVRACSSLGEARVRYATLG